MTTIFRCEDPALVEHLLRFAGLTRSHRRANAVEHDAALTPHVMEAVNEFYASRRSRIGTVKRSTGRNGTVIRNAEQLMSALTGR